MGDGSSLASGFLRSVGRFPDRPALEVGGDRWTYRGLHEAASRVAGTLGPPGPPLAAVLASRSATAFSGILGILLSGRGYVPLNPAFPPERNRRMLLRAGCTDLVVDRGSRALLEDLLGPVEAPVRVLLPDGEEVGSMAERLPGHRLVGADGLSEPSGSPDPPGVGPGSVAYLLFTSGSTGVPKGVPVSHRNVMHFIDVVVERYGIREDDRFSQMFDLTFDLSVFDMFAAWERGACLVCPSVLERNLAGRFVRDREITVWFSVPSTGLQMLQLAMLEDGRYPSLRLSLFCGEALTVELAEAWARAAPNSLVENLYGPTEVTIACTAHRWDPERSPAESEHGIVPIGQPFPGMSARVLDEFLEEVDPGEAGELVMGGPQVTPGYWKDPETTERAFVRLPDEAGRFYRTGDLVRRPAEAGEPLKYLGRIDHQIKIQGYRVEIGEIESALREEAGVEVAVAVGWPETPAGADGIVAFLQGKVDDVPALAERLKDRLPRYMVPTRIVALASLPLNPNGKVDRRALVRRLDRPEDEPSE